MPVRCPDCRTRRVSFVAMLKHIDATGHSVCTCGGYPYPHRPRSTYCELNPLSGAWLAERNGASAAEVDDILRRITQPCPF